MIRFVNHRLHTYNFNPSYSKSQNRLYETHISKYIPVYEFKTPIPLLNLLDLRIDIPTCETLIATDL